MGGGGGVAHLLAMQPMPGHAVMSELWKEYTKAGMNWLECDLVIEANKKNRMKVSGSKAYELFKDLRSKHGEDKANQLRLDKKEAQRLQGDYLPDVPHWMVHPDFPRDEAGSGELHVLHVYVQS